MNQVKGLEGLTKQSTLPTCRIYHETKMVRAQNKLQPPTAKRALERIYLDFAGPYEVGVDGSIYMLTLTDDCMRYGWVRCTSDRKSLTVEFMNWKVLVER